MDRLHDDDLPTAGEVKKFHNIMLEEVAINFDKSTSSVIPDSPGNMAKECSAVSSFTENARQILSANSDLMKEIHEFTYTSVDIIKSFSTDFLAPLKETFFNISTAFTPTINTYNHLDDLFVTIKISDYLYGISDRISEIISCFTEIIRNRWIEITAGIRRITHLMLLRLLRRKRKKQPLLPALPWRPSLRIVLSQANLILAQPEQIREFEVPLRHTRLLKYQRIDEDSDDMNGVIYLSVVA